MADNIEIGDEMKEVLSQEPKDKPTIASESVVEAEKPSEPDAPAEKKAEPEQDEHRNRVSAKERIRQFRRKLGDAERERDEVRAELERVRAGTKLAESDEPKEDSYATQQAYIDALVDYRADQKTTATLKAKEMDAAKARQAHNAAQIQADWNKKQAKAIERYPDFREMENELIEDIQDLGAANLFDDILEADSGTEIVAYFHAHPEELERVASLRPRAATREIGKIETKLADKPQKKSPPPPPETIRGSATVTKDLSRMSQAEYNKYMNERMR